MVGVEQKSQVYSAIGDALWELAETHGLGDEDKDLLQGLSAFAYNEQEQWLFNLMQSRVDEVPTMDPAARTALITRLLTMARKLNKKQS